MSPSEPMKDEIPIPLSEGVQRAHSVTSQDGSIRFNEVPDVVGWGRVMVNGRFYGLPVSAVKVLKIAYEYMKERGNG